MSNQIVCQKPLGTSPVALTGEVEDFVSRLPVDIDNNSGTTRKKKVDLVYWINNTGNYRQASVASSVKVGRAASKSVKVVGKVTAVLIRYEEEGQIRFTERVSFDDGRAISEVDLEWMSGDKAEDSYSLFALG